MKACSNSSTKTEVCESCLRLTKDARMTSLTSFICLIVKYE